MTCVSGSFLTDFCAHVMHSGFFLGGRLVRAFQERNHILVHIFQGRTSKKLL